MKPHGGSRGLALVVAVVGLVSPVGAQPSPAAAATTASAAPGILELFAGGLGAGEATNVAQVPISLAARNGVLVSIDGDSTRSSYQSGVVRTMDLASGTQRVLAGSVTFGFSGDGGPATNAELNEPRDAAIDAAGNVYITDGANSRIRKVTPSGTITTFAGNGVRGYSGDGGPATSASISYPLGIAVSPTGDVVFGDTYRIRKVGPSGTMTTIAGTGADSGPTGDGGPATAVALTPFAMAFDAAGNLFVGDSMHSSVRKILVGGTITTFAEPAGLYAGALAVDGAGNVYVNASPGVVKIAPNGAVSTVAVNHPYPSSDADNGDGGPATEASFTAYDLAFDGGNLYMADSPGGRIRRVDAGGIITTVAGNGWIHVSGDGGQARDARFGYVYQVRSTPTGTYVLSGESSDRDRSAIRRIDPSGVVSTILGDAGGLFSVDGAGNVFVIRGHAVRRLSPDGTLTTVVGTGVSGFSGDGGPATLAQLASPAAVAVDGSGNLYVADYGNRRIRRVDNQGIIMTYVGGFPYPHMEGAAPEDRYMFSVTDIAVDARGSLHWVEINPTVGSMSALKVTCGAVEWVSGGATYLTSLAVDGAGLVYFIENGKVVRGGDGGRTIVAGSGTGRLMEGVPATSVKMAPDHVAIDPSGKLLFAQWGQVFAVDGVTGGQAVPGPACTTAPLYHPVSPVRILDTRTGNGAPVGMVAAAETIDLEVGGRGGLPQSGVVAVVLNVTVVDPAGGGYLTVWPARIGRPVASNLNFGRQTVANQVVVKVGGDRRVSFYNGGGAAHLVADLAGWYGAGPPGTGSRYTSLSPARILDTRTANGTPAGPVAAKGTIDVQVSGRGGVPATGPAAVVLNITVVDPVGGGYLTAWPAGEARPVVSNLNFAGGQTLANLAAVKLGANGKVSVYNDGGAAHLVIDVAGWYALDGAAQGTGYRATPPSRLLDTRIGNGAPAAVVPATGAIDLQVAGRGGVPPSGAVAVVLNLTVVDPVAGGYLTAWPTGEARPLASNLNFPSAQNVPNLVVVKLGADGRVSLYNGGGAAHMVVDVAGWFGPPL